jgi:predicted Zn-dependent protease with MMP-like domain
MSRERFEELVGEALDEVPEELLGLMNNVVILVEDDPPPGEDLLGLYEGHALTERGWDYAGVLPDRILIYRRPILRICDTEEDVVEEVAVTAVHAHETRTAEEERAAFEERVRDEIRTTVIHEIAHHFGIDDERLHELGWD